MSGGPPDCNWPVLLEQLRKSSDDNLLDNYRYFSAALRAGERLGAIEPGTRDLADQVARQYGPPLLPFIIEQAFEKALREGVPVRSRDEVRLRKYLRLACP